MLVLLAAFISPAHAQRGPSGPVSVIVAPVTVKNFADPVEALGTTKANETVIITADTSEKVEGIHFEDGQIVKKGDLLVTLERGEEEAALKAAEATLAERQSAYDRAKNLQESSAVSKATLQERLAALKQIQAEIETIKAKLAKLVIVAPFDGILGLREVSVGALVQPGGKITTIDDLSHIKVDFDVPSVFLPTLKTGLPIIGRVEPYAGRDFLGTVSTVNTQVDPVTRTVRVRAVLPNPDGALRPGLLMTITLLKEQREAIMIPEEAVIKRGNKNFVYVVAEKDGKTIAAQKEVRIGGRRPGEIEIAEGLSAGEKIVTHGTMKLSDGAEIAVRAEDKGNSKLQDLLKAE